MLLGLKRISTAFGALALGSSIALAQAPVPIAGSNQATANAVASALKASPSLSAYRLAIETNRGVVTLNGSVSNAAQKRDAVALVGKVKGVSGVIDQIQVADSRVRPVQYQTAMLRPSWQQWWDDRVGPDGRRSDHVRPDDHGPRRESTSRRPRRCRFGRSEPQPA